MGKHLEQALPSVYTLQCLTGKVDNNITTRTCILKSFNCTDFPPLQYYELALGGGIHRLIIKTMGYRIIL